MLSFTTLTPTLIHTNPTPSRRPKGFGVWEPETHRKDWEVTEQDKQMQGLLTSDLFEARAAKIKALEDGNPVSPSSLCWGREGERAVCLVCCSISPEIWSRNHLLVLSPLHKSPPGSDGVDGGWEINLSGTNLQRMDFSKFDLSEIKYYVPRQHFV